MSEDIETIAQLQHENLKLVDELNHLKEHTLSVEETLTLQCSKLKEEKKRLKSLEQQNEYLYQMTKEKDQVIDLLEKEKKKLTKLNTELSSEKLSIRGELLREKEKNKQLETLKIEEQEAKSAFAKLKQENQRLISELSLKSDECFSSAATVKDLLLHIKELESEKAEFLAMRDTLLSQKKEERLKTSENLELFLEKSPEWSKSQMSFYTQTEPNLSSSSKERINLNLREEILEVELREKKNKIGQLESLLRRKEEEEMEKNEAMNELKQKLSNAGLLNYNSKIDLALDSSVFYDIYGHLLKILNWPEGHSGDCKTLSEVASLSVVVKDGVQAIQPRSVRIIETISIASQTDPVKNLSPVLPFKSFEKLQSDQLPSDSDDEGEESLSSMENRVRKGLQLFTDNKNSDLDMDLYSMSKQGGTPESSLDFPDVSASERDSDNSRDVNLNSKKFADCNIIANESRNKNDEIDVNGKPLMKENSIKKFNVDFDETERPEIIVRNEEPALDLESNSDAESSVRVLDPRKNPIPVTNSSTPKPKSAESEAPCTLFSVSSDSFTESEDGTQTYLVPKTALNQSNSLTNEEICKKFQDLSFAFRTDSMTMPKRLHLMKRKRDQAESNIENELTVIKAKLKTLQYLGLNGEYVHLMTDLKKQLDFVLNAAIQLSSSAESYGYTQHEEKLLEFVTIMLQHVENIESSKNESLKMSEKQKGENKRSQASISLDNEGDEDRILRRRSVAAVTIKNNCRRRASIATLPRMGFSPIENGNNGKGSQLTPTRPPGGLVKKLSFSQASPRTNGNNLPGIEDLEGDANKGRQRKDSRNSEGSMRNIEEFPERPLTTESEMLEESLTAEDSNVDGNDSSLHLKQLYESIEEIRRNSNSQEHVTAVYCMRRIIEWNKLLINSTRFRWPENGLQYVPFYITWYVVFVLALVFMGGLFTGINGCYTYSFWKYSALWFVVPPFVNVVRRFHRFLLLLMFTFLLALTFTFLWLTEILLPQLNKEDIDSLLKTFGLEIRYLYGPPPI